MSRQTSVSINLCSHHLDKLDKSRIIGDIASDENDDTCSITICNNVAKWVVEYKLS